MSFSKVHLLPYNQLTTPRFHIQVLVLLKITYFQEKVTTTSAPIQPKIFTETTHVILIMYLPSYIRCKWILEPISISVLLMFSNVEIAPKFSVNHNKSQKLYFEPQHFTQQKNISYKETFDKISFRNKVLHPNTGKMKLAQ